MGAKGKNTINILETMTMETIKRTPDSSDKHVQKSLPLEIAKESKPSVDTLISQVPIVKSSPTEYSISLEHHRQIIKWLIILYLANIILFFIFFIIVYMYK